MEYGFVAAGFSTRRERPHKKQKTNEGEDITSKLPEFLIIRILSFLPTRDAVRTSVLSKTWIYRWTFITKLDLDDTISYFPKKRTGTKQYFVNFVNRALLLTNGSKMESFSLVIANSNKYDVLLLNTWISCILNRGIQKFRISLNFELPFSALTSYYLFNSVYLIELVLEMRCSAIKVSPIHVCFPYLKLLKLRGIIFTIDSASSCWNLSLPVLKQFETTNCTWVCAKNVTIDAPLLERVSIEEDRVSNKSQELWPVSNKPRSCAIIFSACHMKEFTYSGNDISQPIILSGPSSAHNASANIMLNERKDRAPDAGQRALMLLNQFSQAKCIKFDWLEVVTRQNVAVLHEFAMLSHLELGLVTAEVLLCLLQKTPVLKTLDFKGISKFDKELLNYAFVPDCLASTLQVVKFEKVNGYEHELYLGKFFMENGIMLERMSFSLASRELGKSNIMKEFKEKLFSCKKGFYFAIVEFSCD